MEREDKVKKLRREYPPGTKIELVKMDDCGSQASGTKGVVTGVDDLGTIHMNWDDGCLLGLIPGVDKFKTVD